MNLIAANNIQCTSGRSLKTTETSQASTSTSDTIQNGLINKEKFFYYIVENEFKVKKQLLIHDGYLQSPNSHSTINLIRLSNKSKPRVFKIDGQFSRGKLKKDENTSYFRQAITYAKYHFIKSESEFIGCVRDNDPTHQHLGKELLGCDVRSDSFHDIINNVINVFKNQTLLYQGQPLMYNKIEKKFNFDKFANFAVIDDDEDNFTENYARDMDEWFKVKLIAMHEIIYSAPDSPYCEETRQALLIDHFLKLLEAAWNFMDRNFDEIHEDYSRVLTLLANFSWEKKKIVCLDGLIKTMDLNLKFYREENFSFKPKYLSTQFIEAEKGWLRFEANNNSPTPQRCIDWTNQAISGCNLMQNTIVLRSFSGFGKVNIKFSKLAEQLERRHYSHTSKVQSISSLRNKLPILSNEQNKILSGLTTYLKKGQQNVGDLEINEAWRYCMAVFEHGHVLSLGDDNFSSCIKNIASRFFLPFTDK